MKVINGKYFERAYHDRDGLTETELISPEQAEKALEQYLATRWLRDVILREGVLDDNYGIKIQAVMDMRDGKISARTEYPSQYSAYDSFFCTLMSVPAIRESDIEDSELFSDDEFEATLSAEKWAQYGINVDDYENEITPEGVKIHWSEVSWYLGREQWSEILNGEIYEERVRNYLHFELEEAEAEANPWEAIREYYQGQ